MQSATCVLLSRSTLDSKSEKSSRPRLKSKPVLAMWGEQARVIAIKKLERVASEGKFLLSHKNH